MKNQFQADLFETRALFERINRQITVPLVEMQARWRRIAESIAAPAAQIQASIGRVRVDLSRILAPLNEHNDAKEALRQIGLLPHKSTPWQAFDKSNPKAFADATIQYYRTEWTEARESFVTDIDGYDISETAKAAFRDATDCHGYGLYRSTVLTVFPYIEREFRNAFDMSTNAQAASLKEVRSGAMELPIGVVLGHFAPMELIKMLDAHIYQNVKTQEDLDQFSADPVPNRHAAIHGLIDYSSEVNSLNALIIADWVFFLISQMRPYLHESD